MGGKFSLYLKIRILLLKNMNVPILFVLYEIKLWDSHVYLKLHLLFKKQAL